MTHITLPRATVEQALEALEFANANHWWGSLTIEKAITALRAALAQQAAQAWVCPESPEHRYAKPGHCEDCGKTLVLAQQAEPVASLNAWAEARLARHGIQACLYPNCVGGQSGTVCHKHCPTPCTDCRGLGYDSSGQLCACQQNPSF